jgi:uncharacterized protein
MGRSPALTAAVVILSSMYKLVVCVLFVAACGPAAPPPVAPAPAPAPTAGVTPAVIGETFQLESKVLGETRVINVYLPPGYAEGSDRFPVLYMPDGGMKEDFPHISGHVDVSVKNAIIRPLIVVGVENTVRRRDLAPVTENPEDLKLAPQAGGTDAFRRFLREELKPAIAARYRITEESGIIGESLAGLFVIETLLVEPTLFDAYIAADPSVWWSRGRIVGSAPARFAAWTEKPKALFVATGDLPEMIDGVTALMAAIGAAKPAGLTATYVPMPGEHHGSIFPFAALRGIRALFAAPEPPPAPPPVPRS